MNVYSYTRRFWILIFSVCVYGDIVRRDDHFEGEFSNIHKGRMPRVLMVINYLPFDKCVVECIQHISCKTVNYNFEKVKCELTDVEFDDDEADKLSYDWYNYDTQPKVHGGWGAWKNITTCSAKCEGGTLTQLRECDSPKPNHGGEDCSGDNTRTVSCNTHTCPIVNVALNKAAKQSSTYGYFQASRGNDGDKDSFSLTNKDSRPWFMIDLGANVQVEYIIFKANGNLLNKYGFVRVDVTSDASTSFQECKFFATLKEPVVRFTCVSSRKFRYIRIGMLAHEMLHVNELEVYAKLN